MACIAFKSEKGLSLEPDERGSRPVILFGFGGVDYTYDFSNDELTRSEWVDTGLKFVPWRDRKWKFLDLAFEDRKTLLSFVCPD